ncbi:MAG: glycine cleavage system aminomethyltransferase GcvT [Chloroflexota bacterium]
MSGEAALRTTPLAAVHRALGARLTGFGGWEMPLQYAGIIEEHRAVRAAAGIFDLSHMGELHVTGPEAAAGLAGALVTDPGRLVPGRAHYSLICAEDGGILDDLIVYRLGPEHFLVVPNAGNAAVVADALRDRLAGRDAALRDATAETALIAVQGPAAAGILAPLAALDLAAIRYYGIAEGAVAGAPALVARTGYSGEDGFELFVGADAAPALWERISAAGAAAGLVPVGLGARDTLRLEAGMPLYGHELARDVDPWEAGLGRVVRLDRPEGFTGRAALEQRRDAVTRRIVGLVLRGRGIARQGYPVYLPGAAEPSGAVTSGTLSPTLGSAIALAMVPSSHVAAGIMLEVGVRAERVPAEVVDLPFYRRPAQPGSA